MPDQSNNSSTELSETKTTLTSRKELLRKIADFPEEPGVYLMKDRSGRIIYVGKAKKLRRRVRSYFNRDASSHPKTMSLRPRIADVDILLVKNEVESLLLERTMIKHHNPPFNILLRDDKEYPLLKIDLNQDWPRIRRVRRRQEEGDGIIYLGPFSHATQLSSVLDMVYNVFPLVRCSEHQFRTAKKPCHYYHMKKCLGPCTEHVERALYLQVIKHAVKVLRGDNAGVRQELEEKRNQAAAALQFERAAVYRDQLRALDTVLEEQHAINAPDLSCDTVALMLDQGNIAFHVLMVRKGAIIGGNTFHFINTVLDKDQLLESFLCQFYENRDLPETVVVPSELRSEARLREALKMRGSFRAPKPDTIYDKLSQIAQRNATYALDAAMRDRRAVIARLENLQKHLSLNHLPVIIECLDISHIQGTATVAGLSCLADGKPETSRYRHYNIANERGSPDDYADIGSIFLRRLERARKDQDYPQLFVIDGGKGQLRAAQQHLTAEDKRHCEVVSLAKSRRRGGDNDAVMFSSDERVFKNERATPIVLRPGTDAHRLLTRARDEAHRFAISQHRRLRKKVRHGSALEEIPGIGPVLRKRLLQHFGGLDALKTANLEALMEVRGLREQVAIALMRQLKEP